MVLAEQDFNRPTHRQGLVSKGYYLKWFVLNSGCKINHSNLVWQ